MILPTTTNLVIKNKFAHAVALLFRQMYLKSWTTFFSEMLTMIAPLPGSVGKSNIKMVDMFIRILKAIDEEVVNPLSHRFTTKEQNALNIAIVSADTPKHRRIVTGSRKLKHIHIILLSPNRKTACVSRMFLCWPMPGMSC